MSGTLRIVGRQKEFKQLENFLQMSPAVVLSGVKGVGKTYFVRQWLIEKQKKFKWYSLGQHLSLREILNADDKNIELVLEDAIKEWQNYDVIVWDGFQFLSPTTRALLLSFILKSSINTNILIGDENFLPTMSAEVPILKLSPLDDIEIAEYLKFIGIEFDDERLIDIRRKTAGLPLFINLLIQNRDMAQVFEQFKLSTLPKDSIKIIKFLSILGRPIDLTELSDALKMQTQKATDIVLELKNQYLLEDIPGDENKLSLPSFVAQMCLSSIKAKERIEVGRAVLQHLINSNSTDRTLILIHALKCQEIEMANDLVKSFHVDEWQQYLPQSLEEIKNLLEKSVFPINNQSLHLSRSLLQIYFIIGEREKGMAFGDKLLEFLETTKTNSFASVEQEIVVDVVRQHNRCHEFKLAYDYATKFLARMKEPYQSHLYVEMAVSQLPSNSKSAADLLNRVINRDIAGTSFMFLDKLAKAHAHFQLARHLDNEKSYKLSQEHYERALSQYEKLGQPYFAQVTRLNLLWIKVNERQWNGFEKNYVTCRETSERYGYNYVLAGLDLLKSLELTDHIQFKEALKFAESALTRLPQKASRQALVDVLSQKARILNLMGRSISGNEVLNQIRTTLRLENSQLFKKKIAALEIEINARSLSANEIIDELEKHEININEEIPLQELLVARNQDGFDEIESYPLGQLRCLERKLIREEGSEISAFEKFLDQYPEAEIECIHLLMVKAKKIAAIEKRSEIMHDLSMILDHTSRDSEEIRIYRDIFQNLESYKPIAKTLPRGIAESINLLGILTQEASNTKFIIIEQGRRREVADLNINTNDRDLIAMETTGDIYFKGKLIKEALRRQSLRKLINILIEIYPSFVSKQDLAMSLWAESYSPLIHDTRIYSSVKRVREIFGESELIQSWSGGYRWNPHFTFALVKDAKVPVNGFLRIEALLVSAFQQFKNKGQTEVSRSQLLELVDSSEATVKRALSNLVERQFLQRNGKGRSVTYRLAL